MDGTSPAGIWCKNDVVLTLMRRDDVASTLIRRHFRTKCPLGGLIIRTKAVSLFQSFVLDLLDCSYLCNSISDLVSYL